MHCGRVRGSSIREASLALSESPIVQEIAEELIRKYYNGLELLKE